MLVKVTTSGPRRYVQLVESYRDETGRVKKRTVATLGRLDQLTGQLDAVIEGPAQSLWPSASGCQNGCVCSCCSLLLLAAPAAIPASSLSFDAARALGNVHERLGRNHQRRLGAFAPPAVHDVGIDAVRQGHASHQGAAFPPLPKDLALEFRTEKNVAWVGWR